MSSRKTDYGHQRPSREWGARQWTDRGTERTSPGKGLARDSYPLYAGEARERQADRDGYYRNSTGNSYCKETLSRDRRSGSPVRSRRAAVTPKQDCDWDEGSAKQGEDDRELTRKKKELQMIMTQIALKRAAIEHESCKTSTLTKQNGPARKYRRFTENMDEDSTYSHPSKYERNIPLEDEYIRKINICPQDYTSSSMGRSRSPALLQPVLQTRHVERPDTCLADRHRKDSHRQDLEGHHQSHSIRPSPFQSNRKVGDNPSDAPPRHLQGVEQNTAGKGFQRFLSVLNRGVDINMLTRIANNVDQGAMGGESPYRQSFLQEKYPWHSGDVPQGSSRGLTPLEHHRRSYSGDVPQGSQGSRGLTPLEHHRRSYSGDVPQGSQGSRGLTPLEHHRRSYSGEGSEKRPSLEPSPMDALVRNELPSQHRDLGDGFDEVPISEVVEKKKVPRPEDVQVQNVLQAIGLELGVDELGQLSNRIQERLYGKKREGVTKDKDSKIDSVIRRDSRSSSSSRSSVSPCHSLQKASTDALRNHAELHFKSGLDCDTDHQSQGVSASAHPFPPNPMWPSSYSLPAPMMPIYTVHPAYQSPPPVLENPLLPCGTTGSALAAATNQYPYSETRRQLTYINLQTYSTPGTLPQRHRCLKTVETQNSGLYY